MSQTETENKIPEWLKNLQENSWELELLVSGGAIFSLIQMSDLYLDWIKTIKITSQIPGIAIVLILGMLGIKILTTGFILHLILRAFWLGLVCVNYVYPGGIKMEKLRYKKPFRTNHLEGDLKDQIMKVDKHCGTLMYTSIISAAALIGITFLLLCLIAFFITLENNFSDSAEWFIIMVVSLFWIYVVDLLFSGFIRKIPVITYFVFPFFKVFDVFSFRKFYQRSLNLFSSNVNKLKFYSGAVLFTLIALVSTYLATYRTMHWPNMFDERAFKYQMADGGIVNFSMYRDEMSETDISMANIQSKIITHNVLDLFVRYDVSQDHYINKVSKPDTAKMYSDVIEISIDDSVYNHINWYENWNKDVTNIGVNALIDIAHLKRGQHLLTISTRKDLQDPEDSDHPVKYYTEIPFFKDSE